MSRLSLPPLAVFAAFAFGIETIVGLVLGIATGLSELHKTVLVAFLTIYPALTTLAFLPLSARDQRREPQPDREALSGGYGYGRGADPQAAE